MSRVRGVECQVLAVEYGNGLDDGYGMSSGCIGVARVLRLGGKCQLMSTYPLSKNENSSDLVHYFLGGP